MDSHVTNKVGRWCLVMFESELAMHEAEVTGARRSTRRTTIDAGTPTHMHAVRAMGIHTKERSP